MIKKYFVVMLLALCVVPFAFASAITMREGRDVSLPQGETINDTVFLAGNNVTLNSNVVGDVFAFGQKININGNVDGDIIGAAQSITVNGNVTGNIRVAGQSIQINGGVERSLSAAGQDITLTGTSTIGRDALLAGETLDIAGNVLGSINAAATILNISGKVSKNVNFYSNMTTVDSTTGLIINPNAVISGNINYNAFGDIKGASQSNVLGSIAKNTPQVEKKVAPRSGIVAHLAFLLLLLITCLILVLVGGKKVKDIDKIMRGNIWKTFGIGFAVLICTPILAILLFVTGLGGLLGAMIIITWVLMLLLAYFFSAISFGQYLLKLIKKDFNKSFLVYSLLGVIVGYILMIIPFIGFFAGVFGLCWGIGGMYLSFLESRKELKVA